MTYGSGVAGDPGASGRYRTIPANVVAAVRALLDNAMRKVFDRPYEVRSAADFERVMVDGGGMHAMPSAPLIALVVTRATPWIERLLPWASKGTKFAKVVPAMKWISMALPIALNLGAAVRHGVRELQVIASYLMHLLREEGIEPEQELVTALALSLALDPDRPPDLSLTPGKAGGGLARRWILRSFGGDKDQAVRRRARADLAAIERLDLPELAREWKKRRPYEIE